MITWYKDLYVDNKAKKNKRKIIRRVNKGRIEFSVYCIALASNDENLFDIINTCEFIQPHYKQSSIVIIGLAYGKESAMELVSVIINEVYNNTGGFKVREYFNIAETDG